jgi:hypothetical protein
LGEDVETSRLVVAAFFRWCAYAGDAEKNEKKIAAQTDKKMAHVERRMQNLQFKAFGE